MKYRIACLFLLSIVSFASAQQTTATESWKDSLLNIANNSEDISTKFKVYLKIAKKSGPKDRKAFLKQAEPYLHQITDDSLLHWYHNEKGVYYGQTSNDSSYIHFNISLDYAKKINDSVAISSTYNGLGNVSRRNGQLDQAISYFLLAKKFASSSSNILWLGDIEANIAGVYYAMRDLDKCLKHSLMSLKMYEQVGDEYYLSYGYTILGIIYDDLGKYDSALYYNSKSLEYLAQNQDTVQLIYSYMTQSNLLEKKNDVYEAKKYVDKIIDLATITSAYEALVESYNVKARLSIKQNKLEEAERLIRQSITLAEERNLPTSTVKSYEMLALIYAKQGKQDLAFEMLDISNQTNDSIRSVEVGEKMADLNVQYETEKKEAEIAQLALKNEQQSNQRNILIFSVGFLILAIVFITVIVANKTKANKVLQEKNVFISNALEEREILLKEIHHRVKNNLQIISSLLNLQSEEVSDPSAVEAVKEGQNRVKSMALIHQKLYMNNNLAGIRMKEYLETLTASLMTSYTDLAKDITIENNVDDISLDVDTSIPLALILNELITNSIKYGFPEDHQQGKIEVILQHKDDHLILKVADNGVGKTDHSKNENSTSFGLRLVRSLCRKLKAELSFDYSEGTAVQLNITRYKLA